MNLVLDNSAQAEEEHDRINEVITSEIKGMSAEIKELNTNQAEAADKMFNLIREMTIKAKK